MQTNQELNPIFQSEYGFSIIRLRNPNVGGKKSDHAQA